MELTAHIDGGRNGIGVVLHGLGQTLRSQSSSAARIRTWLNTSPCSKRCSMPRRSTPKKLQVFSDSEVIVRQMTGEYECRSPRLHSLNFICRKLARSLNFSITHIPREDNIEAHNLANEARKGQMQAEARQNAS